jgi:hypothetical protein
VYEFQYDLEAGSRRLCVDVGGAVASGRMLLGHDHGAASHGVVVVRVGGG